MTAQIVSVASQKGGVGKTTTSVATAACLAREKKRVLLIDLDSQGGAGDAVGIETDGAEFLEAILYRSDLRPLVYQTPWDFDFIPNGPQFATLDIELAKHKPGERETYLRQSLQTLPLDNWDFIIFDCPPSLSEATLNALTASDWVLVTVLLESASLKPLRILLETIDGIQKSLNPNLQISGILPCKADFREAQTKEILKFLRQRPDVYTPPIRKNVRLAELVNVKLPITIYAPHSNGAKEYRAFTQAFLRKHAAEPRQLQTAVGM